MISKRVDLLSAKRGAKRDGLKSQTAVRCKQQKQILVTNLNMTSLKLVQLFQS
jgi:hypothetical protein